MKIFMINDQALYNERYRSALITALAERDYDVTSLGKSQIFQLIARPWAKIISSNLKSNVMVLCLFWLKGMTIINGLGRYRNKQIVRRILRWLIFLNGRRAIVVQSYADFRYFRRYCGTRKLHWVPGSGGRTKRFGDRAGPVCVQRDDKIGKVAESLCLYLDLCPEEAALSIVGCRDEAGLFALFPKHDVLCPGYVDASDILSSGSIFLQPRGYGEGFPHTLSDAIVSGMEIRLTKQDFVCFGLYRLGAMFEPTGAGWGRLQYSEALQNRLNAPNISADYVDIFETYLKG